MVSLLPLKQTSDSEEFRIQGSSLSTMGASFTVCTINKDGQSGGFWYHLNHHVMGNIHFFFLAGYMTLHTRLVDG